MLNVYLDVVCLADLENGVSKMLPNYTTLLERIKKEFDNIFLKKSV